MEGLTPALFAPFGMGLATIGAGIGIGLLASSAVASVARQPEASDKIFTFMIITAALIEGVALISCILSFATLFLK